MHFSNSFLFWVLVWDLWFRYCDLDVIPLKYMYELYAKCVLFLRIINDEAFRESKLCDEFFNTIPEYDFLDMGYISSKKVLLEKT